MEGAIEIEVFPMLWTYQPHVDGSMSIKIRLTRYEDVKYINVGMSSKLEDWDHTAGWPNPNHPKYSKVVQKLDYYKEEIEFHRRLAEKKGEQTLTMAELKSRVERKTTPTQVVRSMKILEYFDVQIAELQKADNAGYADVFIHCRSVVCKFLQGRDIRFIEFRKERAKAFEEFLKLNYTANNTISNYLRTFYRIWNLAIGKGFCTKEDHPRQHIEFKAYRKHKTVKRAINKTSLQKLENMEFIETSRLIRSKLYYFFMYYCRGLEFIDLALLKWDQNIQGNYLSYTRKKTGKEIEFRMHPNAVSILNFFRNYPIQSDAGYVFPILWARHDTMKRIKSRVHDILRKTNRDLRKLSSDVGAQRKITTKTAKHSIASHLRDAGVDLGIIQDILEHETPEQTQIYLDEIASDTTATAIEKALASSKTPVRGGGEKKVKQRQVKAKPSKGRRRLK